MAPGAPRDHTRILVVLFFGVLMGALDIAIVGPALPAIQEQFHVDDRWISWIFTLYMLFYVVGSPLMGKLSDRWGRRNLYILDVSLFSVGSLLVALAPTFPILLAGRAVQALGAGGVFPVASAVIGDVFPPEKRGGALGMIGAVFGMAFLIGPLLGALLLRFSWTYLFLINLPLAAVVILAAWRILPSRPKANPAPLDWPGMITVSVMLGCLAFGIGQLDERQLVASLLGVTVWPFLLGAAIAAPVLWRLEQRAPDPVLRPSLFASRQVVLASVFAIGAGLGEGSMVFLSKMALEAHLVSDKAHASYMLLPVVLAMAFGAPLGGRLLDRIGSRPVILTGLSLLTAGMIAFNFIDTRLISFLIAGGLVGLGLASLLGAPLRYILLAEARQEDRASSQALLTTFTSVGQLLSGAIVGGVAASFGGGLGGYHRAFLTMGALTLVMVVLALGLANRSREQEHMHANA